MAEVNLLRSLPKSKRDITKRETAKSAELIAEANRFGELFFDGPREYGYGGYHYDGRWVSVARDIVDHFGLKPGMRVLDVGCAKGFLVKDLMSVCPGLEAFGLDISEYAVTHCPPEVVGRLHIGSADELPFPDDSFDCVLAINVLHNFERSGVIQCLNEAARVVRHPEKQFLQVDAYRTQLEKEIFESWVLTAKYYEMPEVWEELFREVKYAGDWYWTILKADGYVEST